MMKINCTILFAALLIGLSSYAQSRKTLEEMNLKGRVKALKETSKKNGSFSEDVTRYEFDGNGYKTMLEKYYGESLQDKESYVFNSKGFKTEEIVYSKIDGSALITRKYKYDKYGNVTQRWNDGKVEKKSYKTDKKGRIIESGDDFFGISFKDYYSYDARGNKTQNLTYKSNKLYFKRNYFYDDRGNLKEKNVYDETNKLISKDTYEYDGRNNKIAHWMYSPITISQTYLYKYDEKDNLVTEINYRGNREKLNYTVRNVYLYDEQGNWIRREYFVGDEDTPQYVYTREITYY